MKLKILLVCLQRDGDPPLAQLLQLASLQEGSQVEVASDTERAVWQLGQQRFDLALVDLGAAELDAFALCRSLRAAAGSLPLPLVLVFPSQPPTALSSQLSQSGPTAILARPVAPDTLLASIQSLTGSPLAAAPEEGALQEPVEGNLSQYPLAWLLVQGAAAEVTGTLKLMRGKVRKLVYLRQGKPIFVDSNLRNETLGAYLLSCKALESGQLAQALQQARDSGRKLGQTLVALGLVPEATVQQALEDQVRLKLGSALRWPDGAFAWVPGDTFGERVASYPVEPVDLVLAALKQLIRSDQLTEMLTPHLEQTLYLTPAGGQFIGAVDRVFGSESLRQVLAGEQLRQVLTKTQDVAALLVAVEALRLSGLAVFGQLNAAPEQIPGFTAAASPPAQRQLQPDQLELPPAAPPLPDEPRPRRRSLLGLQSLDPTLAQTTGEELALPLLEPGGEELVAPETIDSGLLVVETRTGPPASPARPPSPSPPPRTQELAPPVVPDAAAAEDAMAHLREALLEAYDSTLHQQPPAVADRSDAFGAELYFQEGQTLLRQNALVGAAEAFTRAVAANGDQPDYHAYLAWAEFLLKGRGSAGAIAARPHLERAFRIAPDAAEPHELAGRIEQDSRNARKAVGHFIRALGAGPLRLELFRAVRELLLQLGDVEELERQYRHVLFRLRDKEGEKARTVGLWIDLAYLYLQRLGRASDAKVSLEVAAKLAPDDPRVQAARAEIDRSSVKAWSKVAEGHRQRLLANPQDLSPLHALFALHQQGGRLAQALVAAALLEHYGAANAGESAFLSQNQEELPGSSKPLEPAALEGLKAPDDRPVIEAVVALLSPLLSRKLPVSLESLQSGPDQVLNLSKLSPLLRQSISHASQQLDLHLPRLYVSQAPGRWALPLPMEQAALVLTQELLDSDDPLLLAFAVARALSCITPGRRHLYSRQVAELKEPVLALLTYARPSITAPDPEGKIADWQQRLSQLGPNRVQLEALVDQLLEQTKINLSSWRRSVRRTSARIGLIVCGSIQAALRATAEEQENVWDLASFALER